MEREEKRTDGEFPPYCRNKKMWEIVWKMKRRIQSMREAETGFEEWKNKKKKKLPRDRGEDKK